MYRFLLFWRGSLRIRMDVWYASPEACPLCTVNTRQHTKKLRVRKYTTRTMRASVGSAAIIGRGTAVHAHPKTEVPVLLSETMLLVARNSVSYIAL